MTNATPSRRRPPGSLETVLTGRGFDDALETFGRRLAAKGRSPNTMIMKSESSFH